MKNEKQKAPLPMEDPRRLAYMIAWRDRYIEALQEHLAGREEESTALQALLFYALARMGHVEESGTQGEVLIPKSEIARLLSAWECRAEERGEAYCVRFTKRRQESPVPEGVAGESADGAEGPQG